jgi:lysophospholipase L1-like esterase
MAKPRVVNTQFNDETVYFGEYTNHLLAEGDSWYAWAHLNLAPSSNIPEQLEFRDPTVIINLAYSGDVIRNISDAAANSHLYFELQGQTYHAILLSGGGNDLIDALNAAGGQTGIIVKHGHRPVGAANSYVNGAALKALTDDVLAGYRQIIAQRDASDANATTPIVLHTYDYPTPRNAKATFMSGPAAGPWLLPAMQAAKVPATLYQGVTEIVFDALADALIDNLHQPQNGVYVVNTRNTIARAAAGTSGLSGDWINEIHPDAHGYALLARKIAAQLTLLGIM